MSDVRKPNLERYEPPEWAWSKRIPISALSLIVGDEGTGKSTLMAYLAAKLSQGQLEGDLEGQPCNVMVIGEEDDLDTIWTPKLHLSKAALDRVVFPEEAIDISRESHRIRLVRMIEAHNVKVIIFDAIVDSVKFGGYNSAQMRDALMPLKEIAQELEIAVVGSLHTKKGKAKSFRDLVAGSHQWVAVARSGMLLAVHPDDSTKCVLLREKGNWSEKPPALEFSLVPQVTTINGHKVRQPVPAHFQKSDVSFAELMAGSPAGRPPILSNKLKRGVLKLLKNGKKLTTPKIQELLGRPPKNDATLYAVLAELEQDGDIECVGKDSTAKVWSAATTSNNSNGRPEESKGFLARQ